MLNEYDKLFIQKWKTQSFEGWKEIDIREDFLAPLLRHLGYAKNTVNDILREENRKLKAAYHRIGRSEVAIDYIPTLRLKKFWLIEAKSGAFKQMQLGDYLQAHFYAIHPEIQARYIVLSNGWEIKVYDALNCDSWDNPLLSCSQQTCDTTFEKLREFLSAKTMLSEIRRQILSTVEGSLKIEVDEDILKSLNCDFQSILSKARPIIRGNALNLQRKAWREAAEKEQQEIQTVDFNTLLIWMDVQTQTAPVYGREIVRRFMAALEPERKKMADKLAMTYRGRPHTIFRVHCVDTFARLFLEGIELQKSTYVHSTLGCLNELVTGNMEYYSHNDISNALVHLDNTSIRIAKKLVMRLLMKPLEKLVAGQKATLSKEDLLIHSPSVAKHMIPAMALNSERLWRKYCSASSAEEIWKGIWEMEALETILDKMPVPKYPDGDSDLLWFEHYGHV